VGAFSRIRKSSVSFDPNPKIASIRPLYLKSRQSWNQGTSFLALTTLPVKSSEFNEVISYDASSDHLSELTE
jgi:hypothetical protein